MAKKKLTKAFDEKNPNLLIITEMTTNTVIKIDISKYTKEIQHNLFKHGVLQKLGDAAAGRSGKEAVDSINKVQEGLMAGNWAVRAPATPKISKAALSEAMAEMSPEDAKKAADLMAKLGVTL